MKMGYALQMVGSTSTISNEEETGCAPDRTVTIPAAASLLDAKCVRWPTRKAKSTAEGRRERWRRAVQCNESVPISSSTKV
jgi:hypothetical protein